MEGRNRRIYGLQPSQRSKSFNIALEPRLEEKFGALDAKLATKRSRVGLQQGQSTA